MVNRTSKVETRYPRTDDGRVFSIGSAASLSLISTLSLISSMIRGGQDCGLVTRPMNRILPLMFSRMKNRNGRSTSKA